MTDTSSGDDGLSADRIAAALAPIVADLQQKQKHSLRRALAWVEHAVLVVVMIVAFLSSGSSRDASEASRRASEAARDASEASLTATGNQQITGCASGS